MGVPGCPGLPHGQLLLCFKARYGLRTLLFRVAFGRISAVGRRRPARRGLRRSSACVVASWPCPRLPHVVSAPDLRRPAFCIACMHAASMTREVPVGACVPWT